MKLDTVPGWFRRQDQQLFRWFLLQQVDHGEVGDLAELGVYKGKSAILIGEYRQKGEQFTVIDIFDGKPRDSANANENDRTYPGLTQKLFEDNYLRFHSELPIIVKGLSSQVVDHAKTSHHRFVHIDASHLYDHVRGDVAAARRLLADQGIVVFDDIRQAHTPGVAAAVWEAVITNGLHPLVLSEDKLYGTWSDPLVWRERLLSWLPGSGLHWEEQNIAGNLVLRTWPEYREPLLRRTALKLLPENLRRRLKEIRSRGRER
jgi:hypothetical protein